MSLLLLLTGYPQGGQGTVTPTPTPEPTTTTAAGGPGGSRPFSQRLRRGAFVVSTREYRDADDELIVLW